MKELMEQIMEDFGEEVVVLSSSLLTDDDILVVLEDRMMVYAPSPLGFMSRTLEEYLQEKSGIRS